MGICDKCGERLIEIDYYGKRLTGCVECNKWGAPWRQQSRSGRDLLGCVCYWHLADSLSGLAARPLLGAKANIRHHDSNDAYLNDAYL